MKLTIARKLIVSFLGLTLIVLIATLGLARWSFDRGFLDYVNALEQSRLQTYAEDVSEIYINAGNSWDKITEYQIEKIVQDKAPENNPGRRGGPDFPPPPDGAPAPEGGPPPIGERPPPSMESSGSMGPPELRSDRHAPPTALYDADGNQIAGDTLNPELDTISVPILAGGVVVGDMRSSPRRHFTSPQETAFSKQQFYTSGLIGLISLVLALGASYILTRLLLRPIRRMIAGVSVLSSGDYSQRMNESRNDELGLLMDDLDQLAIKLEENRSSRKRWLADISHELRTPVTVLTGEIETMKDGIRPIDLQQVLSLDQEVVRLRLLIDDLYELSVSDIGGLRYNFQATDVQQIIRDQVSSFRASVKGKDLQISIVEPSQTSLIRADAVRLEQLFTNLISNSSHYTDSPGTLQVTITESSDEFVIEFSDSPPGVSKADCEKLFDPLFRLESSRSRRTAGAGLGLAICRNITDAHRGTISASPSEHGGLKVTLRFPLTHG